MAGKKIYCAGPLFNEKEREDMQDIAEVLEASGFEVFLPHRDGIELAKVNEVLIQAGVGFEEANEILSKAIFAIDTFQIMDSDGLILNMNGRVPDEGAMVEAGIAWALGKPVVIYKSDSRSLVKGKDNPLVVGLSKFRVFNELQGIPNEFERTFSNGNRTPSRLDEGQRELLERGQRIYHFCTRLNDDSGNIAKLREIISRNS